MRRRRPPRQWLLIGLGCGLLAALIVRAAVAVLVGGVKILIVVAVLALAWLLLRGPAGGRR